MPTKRACGANFSATHALICPTGGFTIIRHNKMCSLLANLLTEVYKSVATESHLQPLSSEVLSNHTASTEKNARSDVAANGFRGEMVERTFLDERIFNPFALSNQGTQMDTVYRRHKKEKRLECEE